MSHFTKVSTKINDLNALNNALASMNLRLEHNRPCRYYFGEETRENVAKLPGPYDVAFEKNADGTYAIDADFYRGSVESVIGSNGSILMRAYAIEKLKIEASKKRYSIRELGNGRYKVYDPLDTSGAFIEATISDDGEITFKAKGFMGKSCMNFASLEDAMGVATRKRTEAYFQEDRRAEVLVHKEGM